MIKNYLKVAIRNLIRQRLFTTINVVGLALGIACCVLIGLYIQNELSYDRFHREPENVYRVIVRRSDGDGVSLTTVTPRFLSQAMAGSFPEVEAATQFRKLDKNILVGDKEYPETQVLLSDSSFFRVFTFSSLDGDLSAALAEPNAAVISTSLAHKIFGTKDPIGQSLLIPLDYKGGPPTPVKIVAIMNDVPKNSHFTFDLAIPINLLLSAKTGTGTLSWNLFEVNTYVRLKNQIPIRDFRSKLRDFVQRTGGKPDKQELVLQPLTGIHLSPDIPFDTVERTNVRNLYIFGCIALLVLAIACLNYTVLATARFTQRIKEVGIRKIIGATPMKLILQFLTEAGLMALCALPLAVGLVELTHRAFGELLGKEFQVNYLNNEVLALGTLALLIFLAFAAGLYPALFFSRMNSISSLKRQSVSVNASGRLRKILIVTQFSITITLLVCVGIMYSQLQYTHTKDLGYRHDNILAVKVTPLEEQAKVLKQTALSYSGVTAATLTGWLPGFLTSESSMKNPRGDGAFETEFVDADCDLRKTFQMQLLEGRDFDCGSLFDTLDIYRTEKPDHALLPKQSIILNETAVKALGLSSPVGQELNYSGLQGTVIGVIKDINNRTLHDPIKPMVIRYSYYTPYLAVAYQPGREADVLAHLRKSWEQINTRSEFDYFFLDDHIKKLYADDEKLMQMIVAFSVLAIMLSCLGLFGLAVFSTERRTKEIGIRKVLGASVTGIIRLISKEVVGLVLLSNVIAWPAAYYAMSKWLDDFAYRVDIGWWMFALAGGMALLIALLTVSTQAIKAAIANPIDALRYE